MSEIEVPIEHLQEKILEQGLEPGELSWTNGVALSSALLAVVAAVSALMAGHHANEALIEQIQASDHWSYYQAKGIKSAVLNSKVHLLKEMGRPTLPQDLDKLNQYQKDQDEIAEQAKHKQELSEHHLQVHGTLAQAVTFFQIAIAVSAIALLIRRRSFWLLSLLFGAIGMVFFGQGLWLSGGGMG